MQYLIKFTNTDDQTFELYYFADSEESARSQCVAQVSNLKEITQVQAI